MLGKVTPKISGYFPNGRENILIQPIQVSSQSLINIQKFPCLIRVAGWPSGLRRW